MLGVLFALLAAAPADRWSLYGGETVAAGQDIFGGEVGWPSTSIGWTHGLTDTTDAGIRFDVLYAFETTTDTHFGLGVRVPLRGLAVRTAKVSLLVETAGTVALLDDRDLERYVDLAGQLPTLARAEVPGRFDFSPDPRPL